MSTRDAYVAKLKAQLDELNTDLDRLEDEARKASADAKVQYEGQIRELRQKAQGSQQTLTKIRQANENAWDDLKEGAETAWTMLKDSFAAAKSEFKKGYDQGLKEE
jgi:chromosome segregation ATPase